MGAGVTGAVNTEYTPQALKARHGCAVISVMCGSIQPAPAKLFVSSPRMNVRFQSVLVSGLWTSV